VIMSSKLFLSCVLVFLVVSCAPASTPTPELQIVSVFATAATQPWLEEVYACESDGAAVQLVNDPANAEISLRIGEPGFSPDFIFQIDTEDILIVTHRESPVQNLRVEEVRNLFAEQSDLSVEVWIYASGEDVQEVFEQAVMQGRSVTSLARLATSPQHMSDILVNDKNAVVVLPRRWKAGDSRIVYTIRDMPVLALAREEPRGAIQEIIACLQK